MKKKGIFISSTGTETGKTYCTVQIIKGLLSKKLNISPYKPILSGFDRRKINISDSFKILKEVKSVVNYKDISNITPWIFKQPLAPSLAALKENKTLHYDKVLEWCLKRIKNRNKKNFIKIFEGAGGLLVPIENKKTTLDLVKDLDIPLVIVVGNYLGSLSHTLSIIKNIENYNLDLINIILNQNQDDSLNINDTEILLKQSLGKKILVRKILKNSNYKSKEFSSILSDIIKYFNL